MAAVDPAEASALALPGLGRALVLAGKLGQKAAEDLFRKATANRTSFIAELTGSGAVSAADLAHTMSVAFGAPVLDLEAIDTHRLPKGLLDGKICADYRIVVLSKRNNRLIVATADPSDQQAAWKLLRVHRVHVQERCGEGDRHRVREDAWRDRARAGEFGDEAGAVGLRLAVDVLGRLLPQLARGDERAAEARQGDGRGFGDGIDCGHSEGSCGRSGSRNRSGVQGNQWLIIPKSRVCVNAQGPHRRAALVGSHGVARMGRFRNGLLPTGRPGGALARMGGANENSTTMGAVSG